MTQKFVIAGSGGQGIMLLGKVLAEAAMRENKFVTWLPAYGAEVRGGTAHCMVVVSDEEIASPYIDQADILVVMNNPSLERFKNQIKNKGLLILNSSLTSDFENKNLKGLKYPFSDIAVKLGNIKVANMIALGCLNAHKKIVDLETIYKVIKDIAPEEKRNLIEINQKALAEGAKLK